MTIFGWDASHYDWERDSLNVGAAVSDGIAFMTHKVSEGSTYADPKFANFAAHARGVVPLVGGYCVNRRGDQRPQVDWFISRLDSAAPWWRDGPFIIQLDCERWSNDKGVVYAWEPRLAEIHDWCDYFVERTGGRWKPVVYAPKWVYGDSLADLRFPLWASNYGSNPAVSYEQAYPGDDSKRWAAYSGITPAILQYGSRTVIGSQGTCDANAFRGTLEQLRALVTGEDMSWDDVRSYPPDQGNPNNYPMGQILIGTNQAAFNAFNETKAIHALLELIASKVNIAPAELEAVKASAEAGARAGVLDSVDELVAAFITALPDDVASRDDVKSALREVLLTGVGSTAQP